LLAWITGILLWPRLLVDFAWLIIVFAYAIFFGAIAFESSVSIRQRTHGRDDLTERGKYSSSIDAAKK